MQLLHPQGFQPSDCLVSLCALLLLFAFLWSSLVHCVALLWGFVVNAPLLQMLQENGISPILRLLP